jgi:hypothetical protein
MWPLISRKPRAARPARLDPSDIVPEAWPRPTAGDDSRGKEMLLLTGFLLTLARKLRS